MTPSSPATPPSPLTATSEAIFHVHDVTRSIPAYKIIACIERATVLLADVMREYKVGEEVPRYSQFDKLMSGSSLDGKAFFLRSHKTLNCKSSYLQHKTLIS